MHTCNLKSQNFFFPLSRTERVMAHVLMAHLFAPTPLLHHSKEPHIHMRSLNTRSMVILYGIYRNEHTFQNLLASTCIACTTSKSHIYIRNSQLSDLWSFCMVNLATSTLFGICWRTHASHAHTYTGVGRLQYVISYTFKCSRLRNALTLYSVLHMDWYQVANRVQK